MNSTFGFMDLIIVVSGAYLIYAAVQMKRTGEIAGSVIIGKGYDVKKAKDPQGFIDYMYLKSILMGVCVILSGGLDYINLQYWDIPYFTRIGLCRCERDKNYCFLSQKRRQSDSGKTDGYPKRR